MRKLDSSRKWGGPLLADRGCGDFFSLRLAASVSLQKFRRSEVRLFSSFFSAFVSCSSAFPARSNLTLAEDEDEDERSFLKCFILTTQLRRDAFHQTVCKTKWKTIRSQPFCVVTNQRKIKERSISLK